MVENLVFFHFINIARVNSYILFNECRQKYLDNPDLKRPANYNQLYFTMELTRQLAGIEDDEGIPVRLRKKTIGAHPMRVMVSENRSRCKLCYAKFQKDIKSRHYCVTCKQFYCLQPDRNCMDEAHPLYE